MNSIVKNNNADMWKKKMELKNNVRESNLLLIYT